ncbi:hypothetical protein BMF94_2164 [Rhodotorula taiwanensis]|uniref:Probable RNA-binding protein 18 n=1 Tax=Rhodotorula taiwanensis TaxID=741276 RepID=A0A2S5BD40_9BASI|nr:hypothetical protein BMF94_2164 [Rhodotorula taiwanensis]
MSGQVKSEKRLYVGNLAASVDEYALMQACSRYGKITKLDYLFHKTGPQKGKPRGYAFVEYDTNQEANRALGALSEKLFRGRKMVVSFASEQQQESTPLGARRPRGPPPSEASKPTAISLLKGSGVSAAPTNRKIAALEAKLAAMRQSKPGSAANSRDSTPGAPEASGSGSGAGATARIDPYKAGLPARPYFESRDPPREM